MKHSRREFIAASIALSAVSLPTQAQEKSNQTEDARDISLRGRAVCLTEELDKRFKVLPDCDNRGHVYSLKTADGKIYPFLPTESAAAIWMDERFRQRDLQVTARSFPNTNFIEVIKLQSWKSNKLHDLYYFCDICYITAYKPGPCECCQEPIEFRETPEEEEGKGR
jgi:hypothetical protein